ncbi:MAG: gliding motility-associated C-terminal domain-containing protein, partial [Bacteroidia bacterium]|nr:gliding motility-associated C-terminal domain-containing protein [Bacteroidia bacterium]
STGLIELETGYTFIKHVRRYRDNTTGWNTVKLDLYVPGRMQQYLIRLTKQFYTVVGTASSTVGYTLTPTEPTFCLGKPLKVIIDGPKPFTRLTYASESNPTVANPLDVDPYSPFFMANGPGTYRIRKDSTDSLTGCTHSITGTVILQTRKAPQITTNPVNGYVCPNDSILLTGSQGTEHVWYGPTGEGAPGNRTIYAYAPGNYAYAYTDSFGCRLTSGTIIINEYRVPPLSAEKNHLCPGDSIKISIITYPGLQYVWNNPAGVVKPFIYAKTPGYYSASYTFCGLTQTNGVQISGSTQVTGIIADKDKFCEGDSVLLRARYPGWSNKWLPSGKDTSAIYLKQDGTITLRSVDPNGCTTQATLQVDFRSLPAPPELLNPGGPYCAGTVSRLEANGSGIIWLIDGDTLNGNSIDLHIPADTFQVHLKSVDPFSGCEGGTISVDIIGRPPIRKEYISGDTLVCTSEEIQLYPSDYQGDIKRTWYMPGGSSIVSDTLFAPAGSLANLDKIILETGPDPAWCGIQRDTATMYLLPAAKISGIPDSLTACAGESILLSPETIDQNASYTWNGPPLMQVNGPELIISELDISNTGIFTLSAQLDNCNTSKNIVLRVNPIPEPTNLDFSGKFCQGDSVVVTAEIPPDAENYYWVFSGDTLHSNELPLSMSQTLLNKQGAFHYSLRNCPSGPVYFDVSQVYEISSGLPDTLIRCKDELVYLELTSEVEWSEIMWSTGVTSRTIHFPAADGPIYVEAYSSQGCLVRDSVYIRAYPCSIITENVFTPDGDGINDLFLFPNDGVVHQTVVIFNRWGNLVWQSGGTSLAWDGKDKSGVNVVEGTYFYLADIEFINGNSQQSKGTITLIY